MSESNDDRNIADKSVAVFKNNEWVHVGKPMKHGNYSTYSNYHCRCDECRDAHKEWHRQYRSSGSGHARTLLANRRSRKVQQEAAAFLKEQHPDVYQNIVNRVHQEITE